jgi:virginiamycin B lyase
MSKLRRTLLAFTLAASGAAPAEVITEYPLPAGSTPNFLALAHDGSIAITEYGRDRIGRLKNGVLTERSTSAGCGPIGITLGADGYMFYTCALKSAVGVLKFDVLDPVETAVVNQPAGPIVSGADGNLWYTSAAGVILLNRQREFLNKGPFTGGFGIAAGGDGAVWAADPVDNAVDRYVGNGQGGFILSARSGAPTASAQPRQIAWCQGYGGAYATQFNASKILFAYRDSSVNVDEQAFPLSGPAAGIACAPDGTIWFAIPTTNKIARITGGTLQEFSVPTPSAVPYGVLIGPDGSVWFTENGTDKIGRLRLRPQGDVDGNGQITVGDVFYLINFLFAGGPAPVS